MEQQLIQFLNSEKIHYQYNSNIKRFTTMKIGGNVQAIIKVFEEANLKKLLTFLHQQQYPYVFLGGGSNVIFPDDFSSLIVIINRTSDIEKIDKKLIKVNTGVFNKALLSWAIDYEIGGLEFLTGIPGTIGGAAAVNAGAFGQSISEILEKAEIITRDNQIKIVDNEYFQYTYRNSKFKYGKEVILNVYLQYTHTPKDQLQDNIASKIKYRMENHPELHHASAGCFFKNPIIKGKKRSAGHMIHQSELRGLSFKNLEISNKHANFIINNGESTFKDLEELESKIVQKIHQDTGIQLEREVIYISPEGEKY